MYKGKGKWICEKLVSEALRITQSLHCKHNIAAFTA